MPCRKKSRIPTRANSSPAIFTDAASMCPINTGAHVRLMTPAAQVRRPAEAAVRYAPMPCGGGAVPDSRLGRTYASRWHGSGA
jgi:hypothetical protein